MSIAEPLTEPRTAGQPKAAILEMLRSLPAGTIVVRHDDGTLEVCPDMETAEASCRAYAARRRECRTGLQA